MNIQQFIQNPELINNLTQPQKVSLFQQLQQYQSTLESEKIQLETELKLKQQEQVDLLTKLQQLTNKTSISEIQQFINDQQSQFDKDFKDVLTQYQELQQ